MKKYRLVLISLLATFNIQAQQLLINLDSFADSSKYTVTVIKTADKGKACIVINILAKHNQGDRWRPLVPLYVLKAYTDTVITSTALPVNTKPVIFDSLRKQTDWVLTQHMTVDVATLKPVAAYDYQQLFDRMILTKGKKQYVFNCWILLQYFNVVSFLQANPLQANLTTINTKASIVPVAIGRSVYGDSLPCRPRFTYPNDYDYTGKIYMTGQKNGLYYFCRLPLISLDNGAAVPDLFTFKPGVGITAFRYKYLQQSRYSTFLWVSPHYSFEFVRHIKL